MAITIVHPFASAKGDGADATQVQPSNWNAQHTLTLGTGKLLGRVTAATGQVEEIDLTNGTHRTALGVGALAVKTTVATADIADSTSYSTGVTYQKHQKIKASCLVGNPVGTSLTPQDVTIGAGLTFNGLTVTGAANNGSNLIRLAVSATGTLTTGDRENVSGVVGTTEANGAWTITVIDGTHIDLQGSTFTNAWVSGGTVGASIAAAGFAPPAAFKNLVIKVTTNTALTASADFITVTDGTNYQTLAFALSTVDLSTNGAVNKLDTGTIATAAWYAVWAIAKADGSGAGFLASTSFTAPTMPTGYTFKARVGAVTTAAAASQLMGTWQFGRRATYVLGLAQTTVVPLLATGANGSATVPTWVAKSVAPFMPTTAQVGWFQMSTASTADIAMAPNTSYGNTASTSIPPPLSFNAPASRANGSAQMVLEGTSVQIAGANANSLWWVNGWEDNL